MQSNHNKIGALKVAKKTAPEVAKRYPQIANDYRDGMTYRQIASLYEIKDKFRLTDSVAENTVSLAIRMLINEDELKHYTKSHMKVGVQNGGRKVYEAGKGAFALTDKQKAKRAKNSTKARGFAPYTNTEKAYLEEVLGDSGKAPDFYEIASEIKGRFRRE